MRRFAAYLCMTVVLVFSLAVGWIASDWPALCLRLGWCSADFPR